jgi:hypothetical protein
MFTYRVSPARLTWPVLRRRTWLGLPSINMALLMDSFAPTPASSFTTTIGSRSEIVESHGLSIRWPLRGHSRNLFLRAIR